MDELKGLPIAGLMGILANNSAEAGNLTGNLQNNIAEAIIKEREKRKMDVSQLAEYMNVPVETVTKWESGEHDFSIEEISEILSKLSITLNISQRGL